MSDADRADANAALDGWDPTGWSVADAARILLLSGLPATGKPFPERFRALCQTADVAESIALHRGLPLYPDPAALEPQVGEGLRTNMRAMFEAIAHRNPYPRRYFDTHRWNHMVLKALFIDSRLAPILGLDERANPELARIMCDFAHERWAAGRVVPFEIWRCVGPFAEGPMLDDLARALSSGDALERRASALALSACPDARAATLLCALPELAADIACGKLTWATLQ
ncbi:MAG: EboA domain-containing protein [Burkholderiales bacterium]|nr:EboA domain-containing protein [Burkholderiales bacterium]